MSVSATRRTLQDIDISTQVVVDVSGGEVTVQPEEVNDPVKIATITVDGVDNEISAPNGRTYVGDNVTISCDQSTGSFGAMMSSFVKPLGESVDLDSLTLGNCLSILIESVGGTVAREA